MSLYQQKIDKTNTLKKILGIQRTSQLNKSSSPDIDLIIRELFIL